MNKKSLFAVLSFLLIILLTYLSFNLLMPSSKTGVPASDTEFSIDRALSHLEIISEKPHFVGSEAHSEVRDYLLTQLELLGLEEVHVQEGFTLNKNWNVLSKPKNILGKIKGSQPGKALVLLAHYDSAPHTGSYGASDAGSGVVAILESVRAYLASGEVPKNDVIILFSDAEEIGLVGARLFVEEHPWAKDVGLVVNFEARGSGGPSNMIVETNGGNSRLIEEFSLANPQYPVATSLMYSIYKMLPNDTDSTVFREEGDIDSFFFAFIDDHYDYHTANDTFENLDRNTLQHQGSYAMAMLSHFADADLQNLKATSDSVYFNFPILNVVSYPFSWITPMLILAFIVFFGIIIVGIAKKNLQINAIFKGFIPFLISLVLSLLLSAGLLSIIAAIYPQYKEILHQFPYNAHLYIAVFALLTLAICFWTYSIFTKREGKANLMVAPLFFWLLIHTAIAIYLKGAAYFIFPTFLALLAFLLMIRDHKSNVLVMTLLSVPAIFILVPLVQFFPVGLGLSMVIFSVVFTVLIFGLLLPVFLYYNGKRILSFLFLLCSIGFFIAAHTKSEFVDGREKPNSLVYFLDIDTSTAYWATYDHVLDDWTKIFLGKTPNPPGEDLENVAASKYGNAYTFATKTDIRPVPQPDFVIEKDTLIGDKRHIAFNYIPRRTVNRISVYSNFKEMLSGFHFNGEAILDPEAEEGSSGIQSSAALIDYYVTDGDSLAVEFIANTEQEIQFTFQEMSLDLLSNPLFKVPERPSFMIPKPFVTNDAVIVQKEFTIPAYQPSQTENEQ